MASIMPFPNVTSHRRMPHLPNTPKTPSTVQLPAAAGATTAAQQDQQQQAHGPTALPGREMDNGSSTLRLTASTTTTAAAGSSSQRLLQDSQSDYTALPASSFSSSVSALPGGGGHGAIKDSDMAGGLMDQDRHHNGMASPLGALSLSPGSASASTSPSLTTHDSKMIKTALYDAFGVLYHPSTHTRHSLSTTAAALRSGDVTPLMGLSPKASPLLRPQYLGTSAPITPLELSEEASAAGYFGLHLPTSSAALTSAASTGTLTAAAGGGSNSATAAGAGPSSSSLHGHGHHHHYHHQHHHHHHPHRHTHTSSHLSATYTNNEDHQDGLSTGRGYRSPLSRSRRTSVDLTLDPTEHPVLSSLQTLSITHPHPPEHYHPHLGHDLGHDRVPIATDSSAPAPVEHNASLLKLTLPTTSSSTTSTSTATTTTTTTTTSATPLQHRTEQSSHSSSPFPMDRGDCDSISGFGQQGLV